MNMGYFFEDELFENIRHLFEIYKDWDKSFSNIKNLLNIDCPPLCSSCCDTSVENIQATIFEMIPSALIFYKILIEKQDFKDKDLENKYFEDKFFEVKFWENKFQYDSLLSIDLPSFFNINSRIIYNIKQLLFNDKKFSNCIFYNNDKDSWGCSIYNIRPAICRLFGFSFKKGKNDNFIFTPCKVLKKTNYKRIKIENNNRQIPIYDKFYYQILSLNFSYTKQFFNINLAFKKAFEVVYFKFKYNNEKVS